MKIEKVKEKLFYYSVDAYSLPRPQAIQRAKDLRSEKQKAKVEKNGKLWNVVVRFPCW